jgi:hypothetical protein
VGHIAYVSLSDTHFGADNSVLTNLGGVDRKVDPSRPSPVLTCLCDCLRTLIEHNGANTRPTLVLNGDILELALSPDSTAAMAFQRFIELTMPPEQGLRLFDSTIIYIPGNHDHHLWETARETQYAEYLKTLKPEEPLPEAWHTTKITQDATVPSYFLNVLVRRLPWLADISIATAYPNFAIESKDGSRLLIFTHGHFTEKAYTLMSTLADFVFPDRNRFDTPYALEAENFAWIDFFWSMMGRSGDSVGAGVERIYESLQNAKTFNDVISRFTDGALTMWGKGLARTKLAKWLLPMILRRLLDGRLERQTTEKFLSDDGEGLKAYLQGPIRQQLAIELPGKLKNFSVFTFVFGHTHKPFERMMRFERLCPMPVAVYNSGGWVVDSSRPQALHGGAVVLVSDELDAVSVRMYNEAAGIDEYVVQAITAWPLADSKRAFLQRIKSILQEDPEPWRSFSKAACEAVKLHTGLIAKASQNLDD